MSEFDGTAFAEPSNVTVAQSGGHVCPPDTVFTLEQPCLVDVAAQGEIVIEGSKPWFEPFIEALKSFLIEFLEILQTLIPGWMP